MWIDCLNRYSTLILVIVTVIYVILTYYILKESQKSRRVDFLKERLGNLYYPLKKLKLQIGSFPAIMRGGITPQEQSQYDMFQNILLKYTYLASKDLRKLLEEWSNEFEGLFKYGSESKTPPDIRNRYNRIHERIMKQIEDDCQDYEREYHKLVGE